MPIFNQGDSVRVTAYSAIYKGFVIAVYDIGFGYVNANVRVGKSVIMPTTFRNLTSSRIVLTEKTCFK